MAKILVIDDDTHVRLEASRFLEGKGHDVTTVGTCREGATAISRMKPDVVLLDRQLPDVDGLILLQKLRKNTATAQLPVIMMTDRETAAEHGEVKALGVVGYIAKPLNVNELDMPVTLALRACGIAPMAQRSNPQSRQAGNAPRPKIKGSVIVFETDDDEYKTISSVLQFIRFHSRRITVFSTARREFVTDPPRMVIIGHGFARDGDRIVRDISGYPGAESFSIIPIGNPEYPGTYANAFSMGTRQVVSGPVRTEELTTAVERAWDAYVAKARRAAA